MSQSTWRSLALATLLICGGCSSFRFEPTANWWRDGGRLCAANRDPFGGEFDRAAPRSCSLMLADAGAAPNSGKSLHTTPVAP